MIQLRTIILQCPGKYIAFQISRLFASCVKVWGHDNYYIIDAYIISYLTQPDPLLSFLKRILRIFHWIRLLKSQV